MHLRSLTALLTLLPLASGACSIDGTITDGPGDTVDGVVADGPETADALTDSPPHQANAPFDRVGAVWDGSATSRLEVSTSVDGSVWSDWSALEVVRSEQGESGTSHVGRFDVAMEGARYYRVRGPADDISFFAVEVFDFAAQNDAVEGESDSAPTRQALTVGNAVVNDRASWGARGPNCVSNHSPNRITIHHTVTPTNDSLSPQARLRQIQSFHQDVRGWCDVGYHFLVSRDGRLWEGRPAGRLGTHVGGANTGNIGISFMGTHDTTAPTDAQLNAVASLVAGLSTRYGIAINTSRVLGHRDQNSTSCPGNALYARLGTIRTRAASGGVPAPSSFDPMDVRWDRQADGSYRFVASGGSDLATVEYYVDGFAIGSGTRQGAFARTYKFTLEKNERVLEARGFDASGKQVAEAVGLLDVTAGFGFFIRQAGDGIYEIGLERAPAGVAAVEVRADGILLTDGDTGDQRSARNAVRSAFSQLGTRDFALSTFNADGSLRGTLRRRFTLR